MSKFGIYIVAIENRGRCLCPEDTNEARFVQFEHLKMF